MSEDDMTYAELRAMDAVHRCAADLRRAILNARAAGLTVEVAAGPDGVSAKVARPEPKKKPGAFGAAP